MRDLHRRRGRERRGLTLAEGIRLVEEALAARITMTGALVSPVLQGTPRGRELEAALRAGAAPVETLEDAELAALAGTEHPQGVIAVVRPPAWTVEDIRPAPRHPVLVLDAVQDPGNVGTMLRTAQALGAAGVMALPGTAELTNPKVLRGSMGALFRLPSLSLPDEAFGEWRERTGLPLWIAAMAGEPVARVSFDGAVALVVGNEGAGVRPDLVSQGREVGIPLAAGAESLNVAVAAGILLYEVTRER